jgi:glycosyltransferase involved in cell wall biosynthesis
MKLVIQIPCYNEQEYLPLTLATMPRKIEGIDEIMILIIDDGSADQTGEVARQWSQENEYPLAIARHTRNRGLAAAFQTGLNAALAFDADIIVNTDADNQYPSELIPELVKPILDKKADIVIADRQTDKIEHFSFTKKFFQRWGSRVVRVLSGSQVPDAPSGFRAFSREAALGMNVVTRYSYTVETIFHASKKGLAITSIPIHTNPKTRDSRLVKGIWNYVKRMAATILRIYAMHEPLKVFFYLSLPFFLAAVFGIGRFLLLALIEPRTGTIGHIQSLVLSGTAFTVGFLVLLVGLVADLISNNRRLVEDALFRIKRMELEMKRQHEREYQLLDEIRSLRAELAPPRLSASQSQQPEYRSKKTRQD